MQISDISVYCRDAGSGIPIILLHGNGESGTYFCAQMEYFSAQYRVISFDTRGHGNTERGEKPMNFQQFAEDLSECMDQLGIASAHIVGFSDGGNTAITYALKYSDRVKSLVLNGANLNPCTNA